MPVTCANPSHVSYAKASECGFSLVELMYATGLFMIGLTVLVYFQLGAIQGSRHATDITMATNLTSSTIELLRASPLNTVLGSVMPMTYLYDQYGNLNGTPTYFTVNATATVVANVAYYELLVSTTWFMPNAPTFPHAVIVQTRVITE